MGPATGFDGRERARIQSSTCLAGLRSSGDLRRRPQARPQPGHLPAECDPEARPAPLRFLHSQAGAHRGVVVEDAPHHGETDARAVGPRREEVVEDARRPRGRPAPGRRPRASRAARPRSREPSPSRRPSWPAWRCARGSTAPAASARRRSARRRRRRAVVAHLDVRPARGVRREGHHLAGERRRRRSPRRAGARASRGPACRRPGRSGAGPRAGRCRRDGGPRPRGPGIAQHLDRAGDRPEGIADLVREARRDAPEHARRSASCARAVAAWSAPPVRRRRSAR